MNRKRLDLLALLFVFCLIWYGSSLPPSRLPNLALFSKDKLLHTGEYLVVGLALIRALRHVIHTPLRLYSLVLILGVIWATSDEVHQIFSGRCCSLMDGIADTIGLLISLLVWHLWGTWRKRAALAGKSQRTAPASQDS